jgi:hypothetical protein
MVHVQGLQIDRGKQQSKARRKQGTVLVAEYLSIH